MRKWNLTFLIACLIFSIGCDPDFPDSLPPNEYAVRVDEWQIDASKSPPFDASCGTIMAPLKLKGEKIYILFHPAVSALLPYKESGGYIYIRLLPDSMKDLTLEIPGDREVSERDVQMLEIPEKYRR